MSQLDQVSKTAAAAPPVCSHLEESVTRMSDSPHCCLICNSRGVSARNSVPIFGDQSVLLGSGRGLSETLSDLLGRAIQPKQNLHSDIICKKCYKTCEEYDEITKRAKEIKSSLMEEFKKTLTKFNLDYPNSICMTSKDGTSQAGSSKVVMGPLPKLSPMPKNVVILHNGKKLAIKKADTHPVIPRIDLDVLKNKIPTITLGNESLTKKSPQPTTTNPEPDKEHINKDEENTNKNINKQSTDQSAEVQTTTQQINEIKSTENQIAEIQSTEKRKSVDKSTNDIVETMDVHMDGEIRVIDDDISVLEIDTDVLVKGKERIEGSKDENCEADKFIISEVEIMDGDFELQDGAIVMEQDENGDFLRVLNNTGHFLKDKHGNMMYRDNDQISVLLPEDSGAPSEDGTHIEFSGQQFKMECHDSNEGQIELQVAGDDIVANAILAARRQGATFIKLESGGVFRLQEVSQESETEAEILPGVKRKRAGNQEEIVQRNGSIYTCLLCRRKSVDEIVETGTDKKTAANSSVIELVDTGEEREPSPSESVTKLECRVVGNAKNITLHVKNKHRIKIYICELCGDVMKKRSQYIRHIDEHDPGSFNTKRQNNLHGVRTHMCTVCNRKFSSKNILEEHMNIHNGVRPYECSKCSKTFASKYTHQAHMKTHMDRPRPFACSKCGKSFLTQQNLSQHEKTHSGVKEYMCNVCGKAFGTQHNLEVHGVVHSGHKPFSCRTCGKSFARRAEIRDHERTHTGERPFPCDMCSASFSQRSNLQSHRRACHLDDKRHSCSQCDRRFKRRRLLEYHIKASHTGERPHKCDICGASFVYPEHYKKHRRIHSGEKPYSCEVCGKPFNSRDNRNAHRFVHSDKKPYECMICGMGFMRKPLLYTHMNVAGHLTDTIVVNQPQLSVESRDTEALVSITSGVSSDNSLSNDNQPKRNEETSESHVANAEKIVLTGSTTYILQNGESHQMFAEEENYENVERLVFAGDDPEEIPKHTITLVEESDSEEHKIQELPDAIVSKESGCEESGGATLQTEGVAEGEGVGEGDMQHHIQIVTDENGHMLTTDENGTMVRLVQIQLPGGEHGWVALGP